MLIRFGFLLREADFLGPEAEDYRLADSTGRIGVEVLDPPNVAHADDFVGSLPKQSTGSGTTSATDGW